LSANGWTYVPFGQGAPTTENPLAEDLKSPVYGQSYWLTGIIQLGDRWDALLDRDFRQ